MNINEEILSGGITPEILAKLIEKHRAEQSRFDKLRKYYIGEHNILIRPKTATGAANNKIVANHAKYIVDMCQSYLAGNAVTYAASEDYDIEPLKNMYLEQDIASLDSDLVKDMSIYGRAYELIYSNEQSRPRSVKLSPQNTFVCYSQSAAAKSLFGVYYYKKYNLDGYCTGTVCRVYDDANVYEYAGLLDSYSGMTLKNRSPHYFSGVPIIEYRNNEERQGDFEQLISLIDAYNLLQSDRVNDKEQFVDSFLLLTEIDIDSEQARKLREERILMGYEGAEAKYLSKVLSEADIKVLRDDLKNDIHKLSHVPDLSDESFGNNLSGVAIKYKLLGFEQHIKNKERNFARSLRERFRMYNGFLSLKSRMETVPTHRVDIVFTYNLPANNLETAQMINQLNTMVTQETLLGQLDFVGDPREESKLAKEEQFQNQLSTMDAMDRRDYQKQIKTNEYAE